AELPPAPKRDAPQPAAGVEEAARLLEGSERPVIMAGTGLYWARGEGELRTLAEALGIPVFLNGMGRGCLPADHELAFSRARGTEQERRGAEQEELNDGRSPLHPVRVYKELNEVLDRDAIVIGDGGDFVSYAGRFIETFEPGCWMDPGPFGCLGAGPGQAIGAKTAHPDLQVCLLLGDGAFGFAGIEFDTM